MLAIVATGHKVSGNWLSRSGRGVNRALKSKMDRPYFTSLPYLFFVGSPVEPIGEEVSRDYVEPMFFYDGVRTLSESEINIGKRRDAKSDLLRRLGNLQWLPLSKRKRFRL